MAPPNLDAPEKTNVTRQADRLYEEPIDQYKCDEVNDRAPEENEHLVKNSESSSSGDDSMTKVVVPPDGGWGWVIVIASFMCNLIVDGIIFSFGTFLKDIADEFGVSKAEITLVGSLMSGFYLIAGPFASAIANRYGFRLVAVFGSVLATVGFVLSYFANSVTYLCISYGLLGGVGFGFIYVPSIITIGFYFERWRALATGIAVCGSGIGTFVFAPLSETLIDWLGWRGALLAQGGIVLTCVIYGMLFRPLKQLEIEKWDTEEKSDLVMDLESLPKITRTKMEEAMRSMKRNSLCSENNNSEHARATDVYHTINVPHRKHHVTAHVAFQDKTFSAPFLPDSERLKTGRKSQLIDIDKLRPMRLPRRRTTSESKKEEEIFRPMYREDIFFGASLNRLPQYTSQSSVCYNLSVTKSPTKNDIEEEKEGTCKLCPEAFKRVLSTMLDFSLLQSPSFLILAVGGFFTMMGFYVPYMYLVDRAKDNDIDKNTAVWLVSSIGIANTIGRVLCGVLSSLPGVNALFVTNIALTVAGVATMFSGFSLSSGYQFFYTVMFGLAISCFASLRSIVVVDLLGLEKLTNAFGLLLLFQGVAAIIGAPLAGAFMNATGSYDACFYLSGGVLTLSAILCYPLNWINKREIRKNEESREEIVTA